MNLSIEEWWKFAPWQDIGSVQKNKALILMDNDGYIYYANYVSGGFANFDGVVMDIINFKAWLLIPQVIRESGDYEY